MTCLNYLNKTSSHMPKNICNIDIIRSTPPSRPNYIRGGLKCLSVTMSIHPQKVFSNFSEIWYVDRGRLVMHDGMPCDPIQSQGQGQGASEVPKIALFQVYLLRHLHGSWQMFTNS